MVKKGLAWNVYEQVQGASFSGSHKKQKYISHCTCWQKEEESEITMATTKSSLTKKHNKAYQAIKEEV